MGNGTPFMSSDKDISSLIGRVPKMLKTILISNTRDVSNLMVRE